MLVEMILYKLPSSSARFVLGKEESSRGKKTKDHLCPAAHQLAKGHG
jgi:hypothetical protein